MPIYIRKGPLEIPPGSEKGWASEEHEDYFLRDPDQARDCLPQPYRMIAKVVELLIDQSIETIKIREQTREEEKLKKKTDVLQPTAEIQVSRRVNCLAMGKNGSFLFVGLSEGLRVYSLSHGDWICGWEADKLEVCSLSVCQVKNQTYLVGTVDDMGIARLFYFSEENLHFVKAINETEDISKRTVCKTFQLSHGGDYAGVLLEGSGECWLEVYKLPKDSWLKELDYAHFTMPSTPLTGTEVGPLAHIISAGMPLMSEPKVTQPVLLMKIKPPKPITGSTFKTVQEAVQKNDDSSVFGSGQNHMISSHQWEQQEAIFMELYEKYLSIDMPKIPEGDTSRHTMFHILQPNKILNTDTETMQSDVPNAISVHWSGCHNFFIYLLHRSVKDKADVDQKADIVWPCAAPIKFSAVSSCTSYLALALENETLAVWDMKYSGFPLAVVAFPEGRHIGSLYYLEDNASSKDPPAAPRAQLLVLCTDKSLYLVTAAGGRELSMVLLQESTCSSDDQISAVTPIHSFPNMVLLHYRNGTVELFNVAKCEPVCQFGLPSTYLLANPWQPVYALDADNLCLFLKANEKLTPGESLSAENDSCSVFVFSLNMLGKTQTPVGIPSQNIPWEQKCKLLLQSRLQALPERRKQIAESWSLLRKQASDLMQRDTLSR
ncbi:PREDICTED: WD repeat-containing protein 93 [Nanorana parkeri]|uniref:WD repeat-containing protein 93 n=1 Tax=Nanorana parkeri TaxID=125878 RepID=UPI0008547B42|nr:PREDICTED: WD repeat-containing protein 93 [Nanorana parkeri]